MPPSPGSLEPEVHCPVPRLITTADHFLHALIASNYNFPVIASRCTPTLLFDVTSNPKVLERLASLVSFSNTCLTLRQAQIRHEALNELRSVLTQAEDPVEKRRAATALLRATTPPRAQAAPSDSDEEESPRPPRSAAGPRADLTPQQIIDTLYECLKRNDSPEPNSGIAAVAAFCDHDAELNSEPLPTDNPLDCIEALAESKLSTCIKPCMWMPREVTAENESTAHAYIGFAVEKPGGPYELNIKFTRSKTSRHPDCWLISTMNIAPFRRPS